MGRDVHPWCLCILLSDHQFCTDWQRLCASDSLWNTRTLASEHWPNTTSYSKQSYKEQTVKPHCVIAQTCALCWHGKGHAAAWSTIDLDRIVRTILLSEKLIHYEPLPSPMPLGVQILYTFPTPKMGIKQIEQFSDIILRILRFLAESSGVTKLELFQRFPHCK